MNEVWILIALPLFSSCATIGEWKFKGKMDDWLGQPIDHVEAKYGRPYAHEGDQYTFVFDYGERTDVQFYPGSYSASAYTYEVACVINFSVAGIDEHVTAYHYSGNICRSKLFGSIY